MTNGGVKLIFKTALFALLVLIIVILGTKSYNFGNAIFDNTGRDKAPGVDVEVVIAPGDSVSDVSAYLYRQKLIKDKTIFRIQSMIYEADFKPGTYTINSSSSGEDIISTLSAEEKVSEDK